MIDFSTEQVCDTYTFLFHMGCACNQGSLMMGIGSATPVYFTNGNVIRLSSFEPSSNVLIENTLSATGYTSKVGGFGVGGCNNVQNTFAMCHLCTGYFGHVNTRSSLIITCQAVGSAFNSTVVNSPLFCYSCNSFHDRDKRDHCFQNTFAGYYPTTNSCYMYEPRNTFLVRTGTGSYSKNSAYVATGGDCIDNSFLLAGGGSGAINMTGAVQNKNSYGVVNRNLGDNSLVFYTTGTGLLQRNMTNIFQYGTSNCWNREIGVFGTEHIHLSGCNSSSFGRYCINYGANTFEDSMIAASQNGLATNLSGVLLLNSVACNSTNAAYFVGNTNYTDDSVFYRQQAVKCTHNDGANTAVTGNAQWTYSFPANPNIDGCHSVYLATTTTNRICSPAENSFYGHNRCNTRCTCARNNTTYASGVNDNCAPNTFVSTSVVFQAAASSSFATAPNACIGVEPRMAYLANVNIKNIPTSNSGLPTGHLWRCTADNTLRIVT